MGVCADPGSNGWCQALSRSRSLFATTKTKTTTIATAATTTTTTVTTDKSKLRENEEETHTKIRTRHSATTAATVAAKITAFKLDNTKTTTNTGETIKQLSNFSKRRQRLKTTILETLKFLAGATTATVTVTATEINKKLTIIQQQKIPIQFTKRRRRRAGSGSSTSTTIKTSLVKHCSNFSKKAIRKQYNNYINTTSSLTPSASSSPSSSSVLSSALLHVSVPSLQQIFWWIFYITIFLLTITTTTVTANTYNIPEDAVHITAILGEGVIFNCHVEFPNDHPVPYVLQWDKKVSETGSGLPIYIWYESYPEHIEDGYKGRVSRVSKDSPFGSASLNLTNIKESDQGWYECKVVFLNRDPKHYKNGTWFHLDVHAPPRFSVTPEDIIYVNLGDSIILNCQADGTPTPEILWYKDANPVDPSPTIGIFNDGTELRISTIRHEDIGEYTCIARNGEGQVSHTARVIIAGGAVIMVPPTNQTKLEGEKVILSCEAKAMPGNVTVRWFREGSPVREVASLETRITIRKDGSLIINPSSADDSGQYLCEVTNGIGDPQSASAYLNVEYPAKVTFTPTVQYLPFRLAGIVQCYIKSNPQLQYVTWTKDKRLLEPYQMKDIVVMANGSLLFTRVNEDHQGRYTCTPYNALGTQGSSGTMEVLVRKPPTFTIEPESLYQRKVGDSVEMHCAAIEAEGTKKPTIKWQRQDGNQLSETQRVRIKISGGNLTIENLRREDFGFYQCVISNEVATLISQAQLVIEGTQPHAPYNITGKATESSITLQWMPGYSGGSDYKQDYTIWYREGGATDWQTISVTPSGSTQVTINGLASGTNYEFQVVGRNVLGDGMRSSIMNVRTLDLLAYFEIYFHTDSNGSIVYSPPKLNLKGPKPGPPRNLTVTEVSNGFLISWQAPLERAHIVKFYTIKYRTDAQWKTLNRGQIRPEETQYLVKNLVGGRTYYFRVLANSEKSYESSDEVKFPVPARVKHKAITAGVVGGILFFIVAIILSVCAVKICNKRKRRKQEKEFNMVACHLTDVRAIATVNNHLQRQRQQQHQHLQQPQLQSPQSLRVHQYHQSEQHQQLLFPHQQKNQQQQQHWHHHHQHHPMPSPSLQHQHQHQHQHQLQQLQQQQQQQQQQQIHYRNTGSISASQVPLKKYKKHRVSNLTSILIAVLHWIWPPDRCNNCHSIYSAPQYQDDEDDGNNNNNDKSIQPTRSSTGGCYSTVFLNAINEDNIDAVDGLEMLKRNSRASSSSDDGGFLSRRSFLTSRSSWRRPLVTSSQLSLHSSIVGSAAKSLLQSLGGLLKIGSKEDINARAFYQNVYQPELLETSTSHQNFHTNSMRPQPQQQPSSLSTPGFINTISGSLSLDHTTTQNGRQSTRNVFSPVKVSRISSSSPTTRRNNLLYPGNNNTLLNSPWTLASSTNKELLSNNNFCNQFNEFSSVNYPGPVEKSVHNSILTPNFTSSNFNNRYRYHSHELPALRTIEEETRRMNFEQQQKQQRQHEQPDFVPLQIPSPPSWHTFYSNQAAPYYYSYRPRTRWYPRHYSRLFGRTQSVLMSPLPHLNLSLRGVTHVGALGLDISPESRSSSSGFGSKNTSNIPQGSHHSGSTSEWRLLPPYRPPPPPPNNHTGYFGTYQSLRQSQQAQAQVSMMPQEYTQPQPQLCSPSGYFNLNTHQQRTVTPPHTMERWLDMIRRLNNTTDHTSLRKAIDVGSVDGHYEFDPSTPTSSAPTPTGIGLRDDLNLNIETGNDQNMHSHQIHHHPHSYRHSTQVHHQIPQYIPNNTLRSPISLNNHNKSNFRLSNVCNESVIRPTHLPTLSPQNTNSNYHTTESRLQAMREEFYEYRKRQAMRWAGVSELESVC